MGSFPYKGCIRSERGMVSILRATICRVSDGFFSFRHFFGNWGVGKTKNPTDMLHAQEGSSSDLLIRSPKGVPLLDSSLLSKRLWLRVKISCLVSGFSETYVPTNVTCPKYWGKSSRKRSPKEGGTMILYTSLGSNFKLPITRHSRSM